MGIFPIEKMCKILNVNRSCYYYWVTKKPSQRLLRRLELGVAIKKIYDWSKGRYGSPRIQKELQMQGIKVSSQLVSKLMKNKGLRSVRVRRFKQTTNSNHTFEIVPNRLNQDFTAMKRNKVWVSDITYIKTTEGWSYLTTVIDLFDRKVVGWHMSDNMRAVDTVIPALNKACAATDRLSTEELIFHSDRGVQYACNEFKNTLQSHKGIIQSMSGKGNCYDNAVAESFFKTIKSELIYQNRYQTRKQAYCSVFEYIEAFYNTNRRHSYLENLTIKEFNELAKFKQQKVA